MCFSLEASNFMLALGSISSIWAYYKINWQVGLLLGYFALMQLIHVVGYLTINDCKNKYNQLASRLNYIHICFQPFVVIIGYWGLMLYTKNINRDSRIRLMYALVITFVIGLFLFFRQFKEFSSNGQKLSKINNKNDCIWCGELCSFAGEKHINFSLPLLKTDYLIPSLFIHFFGMFIIPLFINKFIAILTIILGVLTLIPAKMHGIDTSEAGTIWCFTSIIQLLIAIFVAMFYKK